MLFLGATADTFGLTLNSMPLKIAFNNMLADENLRTMKTRNDLKKLFEEAGIEVTGIAVLRWSFWELEFGRARLVATIKRGGHAYSIETWGMIKQNLKRGKKFFIEHTSGMDYDFGTR